LLCDAYFISTILLIPKVTTVEDPHTVNTGRLFVESIMKDYVPILNSDGMQVLRDVLNLETHKRRNVVLRKITEDFWQKVIDASEKDRICALGTPGIGKSYTTCILIRLLLKQTRSAN
jgi:hypothetical protein